MNFWLPPRYTFCNEKRIFEIKFDRIEGNKAFLLDRDDLPLFTFNLTYVHFLFDWPLYLIKNGFISWNFQIQLLQHIP